MATWNDLAHDDPELGAAAHALLTVPGFGFGYLATVRADGGPRVHPVMPFLVDGRLELFVVPSPKLEDLRRDGRWALHSTASQSVDDELYLAGRAMLIDGPAGPHDAARRAQAIAAYGRPVDPSHTLVELSIERVLWSRFGSPPAWPPTYHRWSPPS